MKTLAELVAAFITRLEADLEAANTAKDAEEVKKLEGEIKAAKEIASQAEQGNDPKKTGKFSQEQVDEIVKGRLAAEQAKHKRELEGIQASGDADAEALKAHQEILSKLVDEELKSLDEPVKKLVLALAPIDRFKWLSENGAPERKFTPKIPRKAGDTELVEPNMGQIV